MYTAINSSIAFGALSLYIEASCLCNHTVIGIAVCLNLLHHMLNYLNRSYAEQRIWSKA